MVPWNWVWNTSLTRRLTVAVSSGSEIAWISRQASQWWRSLEVQVGERNATPLEWQYSGASQYTVHHDLGLPGSCVLLQGLHAEYNIGKPSASWQLTCPVTAVPSGVNQLNNRVWEELEFFTPCPCPGYVGSSGVCGNPGVSGKLS